MHCSNFRSTPEERVNAKLSTLIAADEDILDESYSDEEVDELEQLHSLKEMQKQSVTAGINSVTSEVSR